MWIKIQNTMTDYHGVEKWKKQASSATSNEDVIPTLKKFALSLTPELKAKLDECTVNLERHIINELTFTFKKSRKTTLIKIGDLDPNDPQASKTVSVEQVDMDIEHNGKSLGSWRSVCIEGKKKSMLIAANILLRNVPNKVTTSYPGFILHLQSLQ